MKLKKLFAGVVAVAMMATMAMAELCGAEQDRNCCTEQW